MASRRVYTISKRWDNLCASHILPNLPDDHPCGRLHGHNYAVEVRLECEEWNLEGPGFVKDFRELAELGEWIRDKFDHRHLNESFPHIAPTSELLARAVYDKAIALYGPLLKRVRVSETSGTWAEYR